MTEETMVERVARAIALSALDDETRAAIDPETWPVLDSHFDQARAAIEAMRLSHGDPYCFAVPGYGADVLRVGVKGLIDAALSEEGR